MSDVVCEVIAQLPTKYGTFEAHGYVDQRSGEHHVALVKGDIADGEPVLCRVHSECLTGDTFGSLRCDCGEQRSRAMRQIEKEGRGVFLYMRQEGRGIGLINKLKAYVLQEQGMDTVEANLALGFKDDERDYSAGAMILQDLGIKKLRLMTNNPTKIDGLNEYGLEIVERVPIQMPINPFDKYYMQTKQKKMGHMTTYEVYINRKIKKIKVPGILRLTKLTKKKGVIKMRVLEGKLVASGLKVGIVAARFNEFIVSKLVSGALDGLKRHDVKDEDIDIAWVPGAFEIPLIADKMAKSKKYDAVICLGTVIRGATSHYDYVCNEVSKGIAQVSLNTGIPVLFGVVTTENIEQAIERAGTKAGNKGYDCALSAIEMVQLIKEVEA